MALRLPGSETQALHPGPKDCFDRASERGFIFSFVHLHFFWEFPMRIIFHIETLWTFSLILKISLHINYVSPSWSCAFGLSILSESLVLTCMQFRFLSLSCLVSPTGWVFRKSTDAFRLWRYFLCDASIVWLLIIIYKWRLSWCICVNLREFVFIRAYIK